MLQVDFQAIAGGQWWRIWTGHLTHFDGNHLFWDLMMFAGLGAVCERRHPKQFKLAMMVMAACITAWISMACEEITLYRGLSGIDTGLFVWFVADHAIDAWQRRDRFSSLMWAVPCAALMAKLIYEAKTGQTLFVDSSGFTPLVQSHLAGAVVGLTLSVAGAYQVIGNGLPSSINQRSCASMK